ncbi:MAG: hypothetical protein RL092_2060, partial [Bacteroidota bacterium]
ILNWCEGKTLTMEEAFEPSLEEMVAAAKTIEELVVLWKKVEPSQENVQLFNRRKTEIDSEGRVSNGLR